MWSLIQNEGGWISWHCVLMIHGWSLTLFDTQTEQRLQKNTPIEHEFQLKKKYIYIYKIKELRLKQYEYEYTLI